jgi:hypothetical protein
VNVSGRLRLKPFVVYASPKLSTNCVVTLVNLKPDMSNEVLSFS